MMKVVKVIPYVNKIQEIYKSRDTLLEFPFCGIKNYRYRLRFNTYFLIFWTGFESLKVVVIYMFV